MGTNYSTTDGLSTERDRRYYEERAKGGVGMIMTEAMVVTEQARPHHNSLCCYHDRFIPAWPASSRRSSSTIATCSASSTIVGGCCAARC